jgi:hypothetical protein
MAGDGTSAHRRLPARIMPCVACMVMAERLRATPKSFASLTPARVITAAAVFAFGILLGAEFAAWLTPPS